MSRSLPANRLPDRLKSQSGRSRKLPHASLVRLGAIDEHELVNCIIETPAGSRSKFDYDQDSGLFELDKVLPAGMAFPFDFGFIPMTLAEDGDPLDVMVLLDQPAYPGVLVRTRVVGILKAEQTERDGRTLRNDRLLAVHAKSIVWQNTRQIDDLPSKLRLNLAHFFENYNELDGKKFVSLGWFDAQEALKALQESHLSYRRSISRRRSADKKRKAG